MALGGGSFTSQNKVLPGGYINFVSAKKISSSIAERGVVTMPLELDFGIDNAVFEVTAESFIKDSLKLFGYTYSDEKLKGIRDLFLNTRKAYFYKLTSGGVKATNTFATARYCGTRGNSLSVSVAVNVDDNNKFDVALYFGTLKLDEQTVTSSADLKDNDYVTWDKSSTLTVTSLTALAGGTNGTVNGAAHQNYLDAIESYSFNTMGVISTEPITLTLYANFCKRMRDEQGVKFQTVLYGKAADYEGVINVKNTVSDAGESAASLVYWVTGAQAGCAVNKSCMNKLYDGEFTVIASHTQSQLEAAIEAGEFTFHNVNGDIRVLMDINSLTSVTDNKGNDFKENQTIRVVDQIAMDIASIFNTKYLGGVQNDASGRVSLWSDIVEHHKGLERLRAIENFDPSEVSVSQGDAKNSVVVTDVVMVVCAMAKLYMTVMIQ